MGGFGDYRDFLLTLFAACFRAALPRGATFCVCLVDLMQFLSGLVMSKKIHAGGFDTAKVTRRMEKVIAHYQNNEEAEDRPRVAAALVLLLDTIHCVPRNKCGKQRARDAGARAHMDEARFDALAAEGRHAENNYLFIDHNFQRHRFPLEGGEVWRSNNTKLQLYRLVITTALHSRVPERKVLVVDDGPAFSTETYLQLRATMLRAHNYEARSAFAQECLVTNLITHSRDCMTRYMVWGDGQWRRFPATGTGEADIKVQHYISTKNGARRFLVINQDSDLIFILLLHMHRLVEGGGATADEIDALELWLDTHSPAAKAGVSKPYRYIDIKRLYFAIKALFAREFPTVRYPIETFCFLVFSLETDFTRKFAPCLSIGPALLWDLFSEMHSGAAPTYVAFSHTRPERGPQRSGERRVDARHYGLLAQAVQYCSVKRLFLLNHRALRQFYYLACQVQVMRVSRELALTPARPALHFFGGGGGGPPREVAMEPEELLICARDICERLERYRARESAGRQKLIQSLVFPTPAPLRGGGATTTTTTKRGAKTKVERGDPEKKFKLSSGWFRRVDAGAGRAEEQPEAEESGQPMEVEADPLLREAFGGGGEADAPLTLYHCTLERPAEPASSQEEEEEWRGIDDPVVDADSPAPRPTTRTPEHMESYFLQHGKMLAIYAKKQLATPFYGVPTQNDMLARIYGVEWYLGYCRDAYLHGFAVPEMCARVARRDDRLAVWPWSARLLTAPEERARARNSSYYATRYSASAEDFFELWELSETTAVSHKRYAD